MHCFIVVLLFLPSIVLSAPKTGFLDDLNNLGSRINDEVTSGFNNGNWQKELQASLRRSLAPLDNLGAQIEKQVYDSLEPVRRMQAISNMKLGMNGITIVKYKPIGKLLVIREGQRYDCLGGLSFDNGQCNGKLQEAKITKDEDYCYVDNRAYINDYLCFTAGSSVNLYSINGKFTCESSDGTPGKIFHKDEIQKLCKDKVQSVEYTYFPNEDTTPSKLLTCKASGERTVCTHTEDARFNFSNGINVQNVFSTTIQ